MSDQSPVGNQRELRFAFTQRDLTAKEQRIFDAGGPLPDGVGFDPEQVLVEYEKPHNDQLFKIEGGAIEREGPGEYHAIIAVTDVGAWVWRGIGTDSEGNPVCATKDQSFRGTRSFG